MKSTSPKTEPKIVLEKMHVMRCQFEVETVLRPQVFTKAGKIRQNKKLRKLLADLLRFEGHRFIDAQDTESIIKNSKITFEEVEVIDDEDQSQL